MGGCRSCLSALLETNNWSQNRGKLVRSRDELHQVIARAKAEEYELNAAIKKLKREVNEIYIAASRRNRRPGDHIRYNDGEQREYDSKMNDIGLLMAEYKLKTSNLRMYQASYNSVQTFIMQQDTVTKMRETMRAVKDVGINIDDTEMVLETVASTSDRLKMMSESVQDRMDSTTANAGAVTTTNPNARGLPFAEVAPYDYYHNAGDDLDLDAEVTELTTLGLEAPSAPVDREQHRDDALPVSGST